MPRIVNEVQQIERLTGQVEYLRDRWLISRGWNRTCQTPGSIWMWEINANQRSFVVDTDTACRMQKYWDYEQDRKKHPKDYE